MTQSFWKLSLGTSPDPIKSHNYDFLLGLYLTSESIAANFSLVFNHANKVLANLLYSYLSKGYNMQHIYFDDFLVRLWGLANGSYIEKNLFAFRLYDSDNDGVIGAKDIISIFESLVRDTCGQICES